jgi:hypothetical protein
MPLHSCRALGIDNIVSINKQVSVEALMAEHDKLAQLVKELQAAGPKVSARSTTDAEASSFSLWAALALDVVLLVATSVQSLYLLMQFNR